MGSPEAPLSGIRDPSPDSCVRDFSWRASGWAGPGDSSYADFFQAAKEGNLERLRAAITPDLKLDLLYGNFDQAYGETALYAAVRENHVHIVKFLIELGANVEMKHIDHSWDLRPLHEAAKQANPDMVRILLDAGADIQAKFDSGHCDEGLATSLVLRHMEYQRRTSFEGQVEQKHLDTIELLLGRGIDIDARCGSLTMNLLESAVAADSVDLARSLVARGASQNVNLYNRKMSRNRLICVAAQHNATTRTLEYLMGELGIKDPDVEGLCDIAEDRSPHEAAVHMARMLFDAAMTDPDRDANFPNTKRVCEQLCKAALFNNLPLVQFLLDRGVNVNGPGRFGESPLLVACREAGDTALLKLLLERGADKNYRFPRKRHYRFLKQRHYASGNNALHQTGERYRKRTKDDEVVRFLLQSGVDVEARNAKGETPLLTHARRLATSPGDPAYDAVRLECFRLLLEGCRSIDAVNSEGMSALHLIACNTYDVSMAKKVVDLLIQKGADPNIRDHEGVTGAVRLQAKLGIELDLASLLGWVVI
ncbi:hypothetical protein RB595_004082 [Gaeumannomyces hyphopodioides]